MPRSHDLFSHQHDRNQPLHFTQSEEAIRLPGFAFLGHTQIMILIDGCSRKIASEHIWKHTLRRVVGLA